MTPPQALSLTDGPALSVCLCCVDIGQNCVVHLVLTRHQVGTAAYCIAIAHLISHPRDAQGAIAAARNWLQDQQQQENSSSTQPSEGEDAAAAANTVLGWLQEALQPGPGPQVQRNIGFMRWGFVHAFR